MASVTLHQLDALLDTLNGISDHGPLLKRIGRALHSDGQLGFRHSRAPDGSAWLPLKFRAGQPLRDTGRLQRSITWEASSTEATIGTNVAYARAHNDGVAGRLPRRRFLGIAQPQVDLINRITEQWIAEVLSGDPA